MKESDILKKCLKAGKLLFEQPTFRHVRIGSSSKGRCRCLSSKCNKGAEMTQDIAFDVANNPLNYFAAAESISNENFVDFGGHKRVLLVSAT